MSKMKDFSIAVDEARQAFWSKISESYPEIKSGDIPPEAEIAFDDACDRAVNVWLCFNIGKSDSSRCDECPSTNCYIYSARQEAGKVLYEANKGVNDE